MKLLASDFDGTLAFNNEIKQTDIDKIKEFQKAGHLFGMSTGRDLQGILKITDPYGIHLDFLVLASGSKLADGNGKIFFEKALTKDLIVQIFEKTHFEEEYMFFNDSGTFVINDHRHFTANRSIQDIQELEEGKYAFMAIHFNEGETEKAQAATDFINLHFGDKVIAYRNTINVDIVHQGCSKGNGVLEIAKHFNIAKEDIHVIGDSMNDISMFDITDHAFSFPHIEEELKNHVNYFVDSVADCIDHILAPKTSFVIRKEENVDIFLQYLRIKNNHMPRKMWEEDALTKEAFKEVYDTYETYLVYDNDTIVGGFLLLEKDYSYWSDEDNEDDAYYIHKLFVLPDYNGRGYSRKIMNEIKKRAKTHHKTYVRLDCRLHNDKLNQLYQSLDFTIKRSFNSPYSGIMNLREYKVE